MSTIINASHYGSYGFIDIDDLTPPLFRVYDFGYEIRSNEAYLFDNRNREAYEGFLFQMTLDGEGYFETNGKLHKLSKNKGFLIDFPNESSYFLQQHNPSSWTYFYLHFTGEGSKVLVEKILQSSGPVITLSPMSPSVQLFFDEYHGIKSGKTYKRFESGNFLYRFLTSLLTEIESSPASNTQLVDTCVQWIHRHYSTQESLLSMSTSLGVSLPHLSRQFKEQKGQSPIEYMTYVRLQHAMSLLLNTELPIQKIASLCGYTSGNYFSKVFLKNLLLSPTDYRKMYLN